MQPAHKVTHRERNDPYVVDGQPYFRYALGVVEKRVVEGRGEEAACCGEQLRDDDAPVEGG